MQWVRPWSQVQSGSGDGHGLATHGADCSASRGHSLRRCATNCFSAQSFRGGEKNLSTGSHPMLVHLWGVNCPNLLVAHGGCRSHSFMPRKPQRQECTAWPETRGCWAVHGQSWSKSTQRWWFQQCLGLVANGPKMSEMVQSSTV